jgi:hypothetical protein
LGAVATRAEKQKIRSYLPEKKQKERHWPDNAEEQYEVYQNRRRVRGGHGKSLLRLRSEIAERSFAH